MVGMRRIAPPKSNAVNELLGKLTSELQGKSYALFETKQKAMMFAAALGFYRKKRAELEKRDSAKAIDYDIFQRQRDDGFINALAVAVTEDLNVLADERANERIEIFEEYACAGLQELDEHCFKRPGDPLMALIKLTEEVNEVSEEVEGFDKSLLIDLGAY